MIGSKGQGFGGRNDFLDGEHVQEGSSFNVSLGDKGVNASGRKFQGTTNVCTIKVVGQEN